MTLVKGISDMEIKGKIRRAIESANKQNELDMGSWKHFMDLAALGVFREFQGILQAILSDPSIIEVDTEAELPQRTKGREGGVQWQAGFDFAMGLVKQAGWVKPKE